MVAGSHGNIVDIGIVVDEIPRSQNRNVFQGLVSRAESRVEHADQHPLAGQTGVMEGRDVDLKDRVEIGSVIHCS